MSRFQTTLDSTAQLSNANAIDTDNLNGQRITTVDLFATNIGSDVSAVQHISAHTIESSEIFATSIGSDISAVQNITAQEITSTTATLQTVQSANMFATTIGSDISAVQNITTQNIDAQTIDTQAIQSTNITSQNIQSTDMFATTIGSDVSAISNMVIENMKITGSMETENKPTIGSSTAPIGSIFVDDINMTSLNTIKIFDPSGVEVASIQGKAEGGLQMSDITTSEIKSSVIKSASIDVSNIHTDTIITNNIETTGSINVSDISVNEAHITTLFTNEITSTTNTMTIGSEAKKVSTMDIKNMTLYDKILAKSYPEIGTAVEPLGAIYSDEFFMTSSNTFKQVVVQRDPSGNAILGEDGQPIIEEVAAIKGKPGGGFEIDSRTTIGGVNPGTIRIFGAYDSSFALHADVSEGFIHTDALTEVRMYGGILSDVSQGVYRGLLNGDGFIVDVSGQGHLFVWIDDDLSDTEIGRFVDVGEVQGPRGFDGQQGIEGGKFDGKPILQTSVSNNKNNPAST